MNNLQMVAAVLSAAFFALWLAHGAAFFIAAKRGQGATWMNGPLVISAILLIVALWR